MCIYCSVVNESTDTVVAELIPEGDLFTQMPTCSEDVTSCSDGPMWFGQQGVCVKGSSPGTSYGRVRPYSCGRPRRDVAPGCGSPGAPGTTVSLGRWYPLPLTSNVAVPSLWDAPVRPWSVKGPLPSRYRRRWCIGQRGS